jgi:hypothetical protein
MRRKKIIENNSYQNFLMELLFICNIHLRGLCISYFIGKFPLKLTQFINSFLELINFALFNMWICHDGLMVPKNFIFGKVPNWFSSSFRFNIFGIILQFVLLPIVKSHSLKYVNLWLLKSLWVTCMPSFSIFLQNMFQFFFHTSCQHYWIL